MREFHTDKKRYFQLQSKVTREYIIPFLKSAGINTEECSVLEIGCGSGGVLGTFVAQGSQGIGVELNHNSAVLANEFLATNIEKGRAMILEQDMHSLKPGRDIPEQVDIIILKDVIEHLYDKTAAMKTVKGLLKDQGHAFIAFPPWQMPFGGHQQVCKNRVLGRLPWFHLLPRFMYKTLLKLGGESEKRIAGLMEIADTRISIGQFRSLMKESGFRIVATRGFLSNPVYQYKFGIRPIRQSSIVLTLPYIRNFLTTGMYYLVKKSESS